MKKIKSILLIICVVAMLFSGCHNNVKDVKINIEGSQIYTEDELKSAVDAIINEISGWKSIRKVYTIEYCGDSYANEDNLVYCNSLDETKNYTKCALFKASFLTARGAMSDGFNENEIYTGWQFYLAKLDDGGWVILTWGYC